MLAWVLISFLVLALGFFYIGRRLIGPARIERRWKRVAWIGLVAWGVMLYAAMFLSRSMGGGGGDALSWIVYVSLGLLSFLFFLLIVRDLVWLVMLGVSKLGSLARKPAAAEPEVDRSRRAHLLQVTNAGVVGVAAVLTSYGVYEARRRPGIVELTVPIARLPEAFNGFRIVQITDIHAGLTVGREWIERVAGDTQGLSPDLIAFTGDLVDGSVAQLRDTVAPLAELRAPHGMFFVTGNHEYYSGVEEWVREVQRMGYDTLQNEHRIVQRGGSELVLAGVTDYTGGDFHPDHRSDPEKALRDAPENLVRILLAHQPRTLLEARNVPYDLMLSGHTHGGQFFPWNLATAAAQPYLYGLHRPHGKWVYVSKGTGYWGPPVRLGARSEITVITLVNKG